MTVGSAVRTAAPELLSFPRSFMRRVPAGAERGRGGDAVVTESDLGSLPAAAQRYLRVMGVVGRPPVQALWMHGTGWFRRSPTAPSAQCETWQYNQASPITRLFRIRLRVGSLPMNGWDTYQHGQGRMRGTVLGVIPVVHGRGATFDTVIANLIASVDRRPRDLRLIYRNAKYKDSLQATGRARLVRVHPGVRPNRAWSKAVGVHVYALEPA